MWVPSKVHLAPITGCYRHPGCRAMNVQARSGAKRRRRRLLDMGHRLETVLAAHRARVVAGTIGLTRRYGRCADAGCRERMQHAC